MLQAITYIPSIVAVFLVSLVILMSGTKKSYSRYFGFLNLSILAWLIFQFFADTSSGGYSGLYLIRIAISFSTLMPLFFLFFCIDFTELNLKRWHYILISVPIITGAGLSLSDWVVPAVKRIGTGVQIVDPGVGYTVITFLILMYFIIAIAILKKARKKFDEAKRSQAYLILSAAYLVIATNVITGYVLPLFGIVDFTNLAVGPSISVLVFAIAFAMARHRLFDVRSFAMRAVVYVLSISVFGLVYSILVYGVGSAFLDIGSVTYLQRGFFAFLAVLVAVTYTPVIKFFNEYTSKIFYRDAYDTQDVLDQVGKIIVGSIDLHKIQKSSLTVLLSSLRPSYGGFILKDSTGSVKVQDFVGEAPKFELGELAQITAKVRKKSIVYDELDQVDSERALLLKKNDISLIVPLITKNETIGYFIAGPKKSGNIFTQQDFKMLNIVANELAVALQNAQRFEEIQAFNITLQEKVNEATRELKITNKKLIALDEAKDEFISMASHQLRTPLTSIKGYLSMILDGDMGKPNKAQETALKEAFGSSQRMVYLISDFLNVSRIKTGKFVIEPKEIDLARVVGEELKQLDELAASRDVSLKYEKPETFPVVKLDDNKIRQVMMNMVDNAIYYTPAGGEVTIQLYINASEVVFKVVDTGIGVPKAEQAKLFTKFFRAGNARVARPDGTGLGLFMAQKVVVAQGGVIIFESEEGKGSTFGFRFPLKSIKP